MKYRFLTEGKELRWWRECTGREKPLDVSESVEPCGLCGVALARLTNTHPVVRAKACVLGSPHCRRQLKNYALFFYCVAPTEFDKLRCWRLVVWFVTDLGKSSQFQDFVENGLICEDIFITLWFVVWRSGPHSCVDLYECPNEKEYEQNSVFHQYVGKGMWFCCSEHGMLPVVYWENVISSQYGDQLPGGTEHRMFSWVLTLSLPWLL